MASLTDIGSGILFFRELVAVVLCVSMGGLVWANGWKQIQIDKITREARWAEEGLRARIRLQDKMLNDVCSDNRRLFEEHFEFVRVLVGADTEADVGTGQEHRSHPSAQEDPQEALRRVEDLNAYHAKRERAAADYTNGLLLRARNRAATDRARVDVTEDSS